MTHSPALIYNPHQAGCDLDNGTVVRVCGFVANAISARIASLEAEMEEGGK